MKTTTHTVDSFPGGKVDHIRTRYTKAQVRAIMNNGINAINGRAPDTYGFARVFYGAIGRSLFESIFIAFIVKSNHNTDDLGEHWVDLTDEYKTYGRLDARAGIPVPGPKYRPTLTAAQDKAWRAVFAKVAAKRNKSLTSKSERRRKKRKELDELRGARRIQGNAIAAGAAWTHVKEHLDAHPLIELVPPRKVPLLQKTSRLIDSLEPADLTTNGEYRPINSDQVWRVKNAELTLGTLVPYAEYVDKKRRLWPPDMGVWMSRALQDGREALLEKLAEVLRG